MLGIRSNLVVRSVSDDVLWGHLRDPLFSLLVFFFFRHGVFTPSLCIQRMHATFCLVVCRPLIDYVFLLVRSVAIPVMQPISTSRIGIFFASADDWKSTHSSKELQWTAISLDWGRRTLSKLKGQKDLDHAFLTRLVHMRSLSFSSAMVLDWSFQFG